MQNKENKELISNHAGVTSFLLFLHKTAQTNIMKTFLKFLLVVIIFSSATLNANPIDKGLKAINIKEIKKLTIELSSSKFQGRATDTEGNKAAAKYIDSVLKTIGYNPIRQNFYNQEINKNVSNIFTRLEGKDTNSFVVIGAHYDGLGVKDGEIYHGADDNISGVAAVMTLAKMYKKIYKGNGTKPAKTIIFAFWDSEEKDLIGSNYFISNFYNPKRISLYMNFDMVGRANNGELYPEVSYAWNNNYPYLKTLCQEYLRKALPNKKRSLDITYEMRWGDGKGGSDYAGFSKYNIPYIAWMEVEMHADYHKPTDTSDKISWNKLERVIRLSFYLTTSLSLTADGIQKLLVEDKEGGNIYQENG